MAHLETIIIPLLLAIMVSNCYTNVIKSQPMELDVEERPLNLEDAEVENDSGFMDFEKFKETLSNFFGDGQADMRNNAMSTNKAKRQTLEKISAKADNEESVRDVRDVQLDKPPITLPIVDNFDDSMKQTNLPEQRKDAASGKGSDAIPFLPTESNNSGGGGIPFLPGGSIPEIPGMQGLQGQMTNVPKLVWGGFFFVETPMPGASLSNLGNIMSVMQNGQQMVPSQFTNGLIPQAPTAG